MKKTRIFAAMCSLAAMFAVSCVKETPSGVEEFPAESGSKTVTLKADVQTKINSDGVVLRWNTGVESLAVYGQVADQMIQYKFTKPQVEGVATPTAAEFTGEVAESAVLKYASYPYSETNSSCSADGVLTMDLDHTLSYNATNSVAAETPLYGIVSGESLIMKSACAYLKITLPGVSGTNDIYESIKVDADNCCGEFSVDCSEDAPVISQGDRNQIICTTRRSRPGTYYVPILPGTYDNMTITVKYITESGYPAFVKHSESSNTFVSGKYYDCHELSGAYAESVTTGACTLEGTTLSMEASAVVWKYSGITNDNYTAKFFYSEEGTEKGAEGWTELPVKIVGETANVTLAASVDVAAGMNYQFYAQISDGVNTYDGDIVVATAPVVKEIIEVEFIFNGNDGVFEYMTLKSGKNIGYKKIVNENGDDIAPRFKPSASTSYYYKSWDGSTYGETTQATQVPSGMTGSTITKTVNGVDYSIILNTTNKYYTFNNNKLSCQNGYNIKLNALEGHTITKVRLCSTTGTDNCYWGLGSTASNFIVDAVNYKKTEGAVDVEIDVPAAAENTPYYLISGCNTNRLGSITITYEK